MSGRAVTWAMEQITGSPAAKLVLVKLAENAGEDGFCWPSIDLIVKHTELGQSTVYKHLTALQELGLFHMVEHQIGKSVMHAYQLHVPDWEEMILRRGKGRVASPRHGKEIPPGGNTSPPAGKTVPPGGMHIDEPSLEPPIEPSSEPSHTAIAVRGAPADIDLAVLSYNEMAEKLPKWISCQQMTTQRRKVIDARLREVGLAGWRAALALAAASGFLGGAVPAVGEHKNWRVNIAWFAKAENFAKISEGGYPAARGVDRPVGIESAAHGLMDFLQERGQ